MIKFHALRDSSIKTNTFVAYLLSLFLIFTSTFVHAKHRKSNDSPHVTRTRIMIHKVKPGEKPTELFSNLNTSEAHKIISFNREKTYFATISTDRPLESRGLSSSHDAVSRNPYFGRRFTNYTHKFNMMQLASSQGIITSSLSEAGKKAGLSEELMDQLTHIFAWDIDFATNLHNGDRFTIVYERGGFNGTDDIVAAEFVNRGKIFRAVRYIDKEGFANYYTPEGDALQKAFLTTPVDFARISSHFNLSRKHPVLNRIRAHKGVDYAARTGTPVKATGSGEVVFQGRKGGYGQVVILKHGDRYETVYAHLSRFKAGMQEGSVVRQGDIIGYVGQTGLATGPHLHYEFRIDGVHQNPLTAQLSNSIPVRGMGLADFKSQTQDSLAKLNLVKANSLFAKNYNPIN